MAETLAKAEKSLSEEEPDDAHTFATQALNSFRAAGEKRGVADATRVLVHALVAQDRMKEASDVAKAELALFREAGDVAGEAKMLLSHAEANADKRGNAKRVEALRKAEDALKLFKDQKDKKHEARAYLTMARIHLKLRGETSKAGQDALEAAGAARTLFAELGDRKHEAMALHALAAANIRSHKLDDGVKASREALAILRDLGLKRLVVFELTCIAQWFLAEGKVTQAQTEAEEALSVSREAQCGAQWEANALAVVFRAHALQGRTTQALQLAKEALSNFRSRRDAVGEAVALDMLVNAHVLAHDPKIALQTAEEAVSVFRTLGDKKYEASMLRNIADLHLKRQHLEKALRAAQKSLAIFQDLGDSDEKALTLHVLAEVHIARQEAKEAIKATSEERNVFQDRGSRGAEAAALLIGSVAQLSKGKLVEAQISATEAKDIYDELKNTKGQSIALATLAEIQMSRKNYLEAQELAEGAREVMWELGDREGEVNMLLLSSHASLWLLVDKKGKQGGGQVEKASQAVEKALDLSQVMDNDRLKGFTLRMRSQLHLFSKKTTEATADVLDAQKVFKKAGEKAGEAVAFIMCATLYIIQGSLPEAKKALSQGVEIAAKIGDTFTQGLGDDVSARLQEAFATVASQGAAPKDAATAPVQKKAAHHEEAQIVLKDLKQVATAGDVTSAVHSIAAQLTQSEDLELDVPLMQAGLTSRTSVEFRNALSDTIPQVTLPFTLMFDHPTVNAISEFIKDKM